MNRRSPFLYRISQFISVLLGTRFFVVVFYTFALYVSTFFLFNQEESLHRFVFDIKVHGIILCSVLSVASGGLINQFYDLEKDKIQKPFRSQLQSFLKQKYFLYLYVFLNAVSLGVAGILSYRIFIFFLVYQFFIWFYSHKLSKIFIVNNLTYVSLTLYPFFGLLVYYQHFSLKLFWMATFLFLILWMVDVMKDILTMRPDRIFGYNTVPLKLGIRNSIIILSAVLLLNAGVADKIVASLPFFNYLVVYFSLSALVMIASLIPLWHFRIQRIFWLMNLLRLWIFVGVIFMLMNGIFEKF